MLQRKPTPTVLDVNPMSNEIADRVQDALVELNAEFEVIDIDPAFTHTADFCARYGYDLEHSGNAILVASKRPVGHHALCLATATTRLDVNRRVRGLMEVRKLSFASAELTVEVTGMEIGGVTPFGLPYHLPIYVDSRIMKLPKILVGGGNRSTKIFVNTEVFERMESVLIVEGLAQPLPA